VAKRNGKSESPAGAKSDKSVGDYRHQAKRKNNPPAKIAAEGAVPVLAKAAYAYNPHLPPVLRFDQTGKADVLETRLSAAAQARADKLLAQAQQRPLKPEEAAELAELLAAAAKARVAAEPWLEWTGKRERKGFEVDPVALHIHERVSTQAILKVAQRQDAARSLFADPEQDYHEAVQFYRHDVDWANRLILGDSLQVMSSLAKREDLAGKVQMIYLDPPYGIKFASNFQPEVRNREVKEKQEDLTREPEMVRAYRDTWHLGVHSYLSYLRDRLVAAQELLADTGSIFVQISDENLHRVRTLIDEVFKPTNAIGTITFRTTSSRGGNYLGQSANYLLWYGKQAETTKWRSLFKSKGYEDDIGGRFSRVDTPTGERRPLIADERGDVDSLPAAFRIYRHDNLTSQSGGENSRFPVVFDGMSFVPGRGFWKTNTAGFRRLAAAERLGAPTTNSLAYVRFITDFPVSPLSEVWTDTQTGAFTDEKTYVVQTNTKVVERCMLMTTDPGDLVLDPTCGSGTTACVAEQWGRRWITVDTSRVAVAIARQRLMTAKFDFYKLKDEKRGTAGGFNYKTVPHVTLKSIAQNVALDPIFAKHEPMLEAALQKANAELAKVKPDLRAKLAGKLTTKERAEGKRAVTDADRRRWILPPDHRDKSVKYTVDAGFRGWYAWEVPFDTDPDWPVGLSAAVTAYRKAWRAKMDEVNACIDASAEQEELVDQPETVRNVTRVSGPFTVEAVQPPEMSLGEDVANADKGEFAGGPEEVGGRFTMREVETTGSLEAANVGAYLDQMLRYLKADGVRFLNNKSMKWSRLESLFESGTGSGFHAEGRWTPTGETDGDPDGPANVGVVFGPQYGPVTAKMIEELIRPAGRRYEHLVVAAFNFTAEAQAILSEGSGGPHPKLKIHFAHVRPDINPGMNGLLKESPTPGSGQLFTVFGLPRIDVRKQKDGQYVVTMEGVDVYNPVNDSITSTGASKVAAWFIDGDYDGRTFCITQAFFPDRSAWDKLAKALNGKDGLIDASAFEAFSGTESLPFPAGKNGCVAVKVIDPRGNELMTVEKLEGVR
jgi:adenine-specific DNA-methyltransferase